MRYAETVILKDGVELLVRNAVASDARALRDIMQRTHAETDYLLSYPDEQSADDEQEARSLVETERSNNEVELVATVDGRIVGSAGIAAVGGRRKVVHRRALDQRPHRTLGMGIGRVLMEASIDCARRAGYTQLELEVVADNQARSPSIGARGSRSMGATLEATGLVSSGYQELVHMRLEL